MFFNKLLKLFFADRVRGERGVSLVEVVVSVFVIILILSIFSASLASLSANKSNQNRSSAYGFAEAELAALKNYPFDNLTERINGDFVGLAYNIGRQKIVSDAGALSPTQVQSVEPADVAVGGNISSAAILPESYYEDFTFSGYIKILSSSAPDWQTGIVFRYLDVENYYYWSITSSSMKLSKVVSGTPTVLWTTGQIFDTGTWYKLKVVGAGSSLQGYLNDVLKIDQSDSDLEKGYLGFLGKNTTYYYVDDVHLESPVGNDDWFFDAETVGNFPEGFLNISPSGLSGFVGRLTVQNYYSGTDIKKITAKVIWQEKGSSEEIQLSTLRNRVYE